MKTCLDCGFVTIDGMELTNPDRIMLASGGVSAKMPAHADGTRCFKNLWEYDVHYAGDSWDGVKNELEESRDDCAGFRAYEAGFNPIEHKAHQEQDRLQAVQWRVARLGFVGSVLGGLLGTGIAALIRWLSDEF